MTGKEIKTEVLMTLSLHHHVRGSDARGLSDAHAALAPCVVLTREEADEILLLFASVYWGEDEPQGRALALITPEEPS